jgi:hypothetical protein
MAKNTGRGSRAAANSPTAGQFVRAKERGGAFRGIHDERPWDQRHPIAAAVAIVAPVTGLMLLLALLIVEAGL